MLCPRLLLSGSELFRLSQVTNPKFENVIRLKGEECCFICGRAVSSVCFSSFIDSLPQGIRWTDFGEPAWPSVPSFSGPRRSWVKFRRHHSWPWTLWYVFVSPVSRYLSALWQVPTRHCCPLLPTAVILRSFVLSVFMAIMNGLETSGGRLHLPGLNNIVINLIKNSPKLYSPFSWMAPLLLWYI